MSVFDLDASIRDVTAKLADTQKVDVLISAMQHLHLERSSALIENFTESCLQLPNLSPELSNKTLLLRAKARLAANLHTSAHEDLEAILEVDPDHSEARALINSAVQHQSNHSPGLSTEIWHEIALLLPRRDLKTLLSVPHVLSRVASQLLFRQVDLHFTLDTKESERSADILTRIFTDPSFALHIRTLRLFAPEKKQPSTMAFQSRILVNALPKLTNLCHVYCNMEWKDIELFVRALENTHHKLCGLSFVPTNTAHWLPPKFRHLTQFTYSACSGSPQGVNIESKQSLRAVHALLRENKESLRVVRLENAKWTFPSEYLALHKLTHLNFSGTLGPNSTALLDILNLGVNLESLRLHVSVLCCASEQLRRHMISGAHALPSLRHFAFVLHDHCEADADLFPALADFLRDHAHLHSLQLTVEGPKALSLWGYDERVWSILPILWRLKTLDVMLLKSIPPNVAMWLVPHGLTSLSLHSFAKVPTSFVKQLRDGLHPNLRFIGLLFRVENVVEVIAHSFPMVRAARVRDKFYTVHNTAARGVQVEEWPQSRALHHAGEWLEWFGCEHPWRNPMECD
ncbi:hypothetical protein BDW22DRAFT_1430285 [Trametopsis cervina]|nr:hypothetical protein BDW22DRAFT_1430285 [Trametopsis cervina]